MLQPESPHGAPGVIGLRNVPPADALYARNAVDGGAVVPVHVQFSVFRLNLIIGYLSPNFDFVALLVPLYVAPNLRIYVSLGIVIKSSDFRLEGANDCVSEITSSGGRAVTTVQVAGVTTGDAGDVNGGLQANLRTRVSARVWRGSANSVLAMLIITSSFWFSVVHFPTRR